MFAPRHQEARGPGDAAHSKVKGLLKKVQQGMTPICYLIISKRFTTLSLQFIDALMLKNLSSGNWTCVLLSSSFVQTILFFMTWMKENLHKHII